MKTPSFIRKTGEWIYSHSQNPVIANILKAGNWCKAKTSKLSRLAWIWLSSGAIVLILLIFALFHYPIWHTNEIVNETASTLGFEDTPEYNANTTTDSLVLNALDARIYSHGVDLEQGDPSTEYAAPADDSEAETPEDTPSHGTDTPAPSHAVDPYDTPES